MSAGKYVAPNYTTQSGTVYPLGIDKAAEIMRRLAAMFNPSAQDTPNMTVLVDAGSLYKGKNLTEVAAQNTAVITAPVTDPRIDRVQLDPNTGAISIVAGVEAASPIPTDYDFGFLPICQILLSPSTTQITDSLITDERQLLMVPIRVFVWDLLDDADATTFMTTLRDGLAVETAPAVDDEVFIRDTSATAVDRITLQNLLKVINALTEDTTPDRGADFVTTYDASAALPKKVKLENLVNVKPLAKDHGTKSGAYTLQLDEADLHLVAFSAAATLTIASANTNDKATVVVKNGGNAITLAGIDNDSPTLTNAATSQDLLAIVKSFGKISVVGVVLNRPTV